MPLGDETTKERRGEKVEEKAIVDNSVIQSIAAGFFSYPCNVGPKGRRRYAKLMEARGRPWKINDLMEFN